MNWDYFISHATEDKLLVARPLAHILQHGGFNVWFDEFTLNVGDSLLASIDRGLRDSAYGVTVLSRTFFEKKWPPQELAGLFSLEGPGSLRILPVWHGVGAQDVKRFSPIIADRVAATTDTGLQHVAEQIVRASFPRRVKSFETSLQSSLAVGPITEARKLIQKLLDEDRPIEEIRLLISSAPELLSSLAGYSPRLIPAFKLSMADRCDYVQIVPHGVTGPVDIRFIALGPIIADFDEFKRQAASFVDRLGIHYEERSHSKTPILGEFPALHMLCSPATRLISSANVSLQSSEEWKVHLLLFCGRRTPPSVGERVSVSAKINVPIDIASYDRLIEQGGGG